MNLSERRPFRKSRFLLAGAVFVLACAQAAYAQNPFLRKDDYAGVVLLLGEKATDAEKAAAAEFATYWKRVTGAGTLTAKKPLKNLGMNVWIGRSSIPEEMLSQVKLDGLGDDGFCIRTFRVKKAGAGHLLIAGEKDSGTLCGVYQFIEDYLGVRFLTPDLMYSPSTPPSYIPEINTRYVPPIKFREMTYNTIGMQGVADDLRIPFTRHMRWNSRPASGLPDYSAFTLLPPDKYFAEHPDFYSEIGGKRIAPLGIDLTVPENMAQHGDLRSQLCFSNTKVAEAIAEELKPLMKAAPEKKIWSVSQMNWDAYCTCAACREINDREGTPMAAVLTCVNRVADMIRSEFPENRIETLACQWSRKPPKSIIPRENVIVSLSALDCDYAKAITDPSSAVNRAFAEDIVGWAKIARELYVRDYPANRFFSQIPFPNFNVLGANYAFYAQHSVRGMSLSGGAGLADDFGALRCYMLSSLLWKPDVDANALMSEFMKIYYEDAAPYMRSYIDLLTRTMQAKGVILKSDDKASWIDVDTILQAEEILKQAAAAAKNDAVKQRIEDAYSSVRYCALVCPPKIETKEGKFTVTRPPCMTIEEYIKYLETRAYKPFEPGAALPDYVMARVGKVLPPRSEESPLQVLENENYLIWIASALKGSIVRWQDKRSGAEFLRGFERYGNGTWQDWRSSTPSPIAETYEVAEQKPETVTLRAKRDDGLEIERAMTLKPGSDTFDVAVAITNVSDKPVEPDVSFHPEFFTQRETPEIYLCKDGKWAKQEGRTERKSAKVDGESRIAFHLPACKNTLICTFDPKEVDSVSWFYSTSGENPHCNLEFSAKTGPLKPKEKLALHGTYTILRGKPLGM